MWGSNLKITIDGKEIDAVYATFTFATVTEGCEATFYTKKECSASVEFDMNYDLSHPFFLQFDPNLTDWPHLPLVRISSQRVSDITTKRE